MCEPLMTFHYPKGGSFDLPTSWWLEAGMDNFLLRSNSYRTDDTPDSQLIPLELVIIRGQLRAASLRYHQLQTQSPGAGLLSYITDCLASARQVGGGGGDVRGGALHGDGLMLALPHLCPSPI
jgi:hypothetical protein